MSIRPDFEIAAGEPATIAPAPAAGDVLAQEIHFLNEVKQLIADRQAAEARIESQHASSIQSAERIFQRSREGAEQWSHSEQQTAETELAETRRRAQLQFDHEMAAAENGFTALQAEVADQHQSVAAAAKRVLEEDVWEAEAFYNAHKNEAPKQLEEFERHVGGLLTRLRGDLAHAQQLLEHWRIAIPEAADAPAPPAQSEGSYADRLQERGQFVSEQQARLSRLRLPSLIASGSLLYVYGIAVVLGAVLASGLLGMSLPAVAGAVAVAVVLGAVGGFYLYKHSRRTVEQTYVPLHQGAREAEELAKLALDDARTRTAAHQAALKGRYDRARQAAQQKRQSAIAEADRQRDNRIAGPAARYAQRMDELTARRDREVRQSEETYEARQADIRRRKGSELAEAQNRYSRQTQQVLERYENEWQVLADDWRAGLLRLQSLAAEIRGRSPQNTNDHWRNDWDALTGQSWSPATGVPAAVRFGLLQIRMDQFPGGSPENERLAGIGPTEFTLPALASFRQRPSLLLKARGEGRRLAIEAMQSYMLRLLVSLPADKARFTIIDPVGLGDNFSAFMHLSEYNDALVTSRIWTEQRHIEQQLADLSEHMENVIQNYLRNEYETIEDYNRDAGDIAEPYRFLVVANFPANFTEAAQRRLLSIASSGPRCGVYTIIMVDRHLNPPGGSYLRDLESQSTTLAWKNDRFVWEDDRFGDFELTTDAPPAPERLNEILHTAGRHASRAGKVEVSFDVVAPQGEDIWSASARSGIEVPLGVAGATRRQFMRLGQGTSQHVLVAGKTGSGKSTLLHALITSLALRYDPNEVELYLIDFKQGVEFKAYANEHLPHARVVAIESDREFGISVLNRLDAELKLRADRFRALGVQDLAGFREADGRERMPRIVLIVDEFQEFFVEDDRISQDAALLLDRLVRQGRAFGIHVILGSQTLAGAYTLARSTMGQIAVRIALQCSEADAHLILSEDNTAARLLSRPGEAIYNDANGLIEGNQRFQIAWLPDERREQRLRQVHALEQQREVKVPQMVVFEGNVPADPRRNEPLSALLHSERPNDFVPQPQVWLGEPVAITGPTAATFSRQSGSNLLIVGQNEEAVLGMVTTAVVSLLAQRPGSAQQVLETDAIVARASSPRPFRSESEDTGETPVPLNWVPQQPLVYLFDGSAPGSRESQWIERLSGLVPDAVRLVRPKDLAVAIGELSSEIDRRQHASDKFHPPVFALIYGLQKFRDLRRQEDDFSFSRMGEAQPVSPAKQLGVILREGPPLGVHLIAWCDNVNNLNRSWDRQMLREIEMRVALQMSTSDSSTLIDTPLASRLGMHRALLHHEEHGTLDKFRPYSLPSEDWLMEVASLLGTAERETNHGGTEDTEKQEDEKQ